MNHPDLIWHNGEIKRWQDATVHVMAHAIHYGSSVFEGIRAYATPQGPAVFRLAEHIDRLYDSAKIHRIAIPWSADEIRQACKRIIAVNGLKSAYLRPIVYRGVSGMSLTPAVNAPVELAIAAIPFGAYLGEEGLKNGIDACVTSWNRAAPNTFPAMAKAGGNYLNSQLIAGEARRHGYGEGIALAVDGTLSEGAGENLFVVRKGVIHTPPSAASILVGITRDTVMTLAAELGYRIVETAMPREFLYLADELFMTGTAAEITPVRSVDGIVLGAGTRGPITAALQDAFFGLFDGRTADRWGWLDPVRAEDAALAEVA